MSVATSDLSEGFSPLDSKAAPPPVEDGDVTLMLQAGTGSQKAFAELVQRHQNALLNFFIRMGALNDGEDLVQETFLRLYRYRKRYRPTARFNGLLYHLARNVWADHNRKLARIDRVATSFEAEMQLVRPASSQASGRALDVQTALDRLSPKLREVLVLNVYQQLRYQEIAEALNIPLGTVKSRINLALAALKEIFHG